MSEDLARRLERVEERLARLEARAAAATPTDRGRGRLLGLEVLKSRAQDVVLYTGAVTLPTGEHYEWQESRTLEDLLVVDQTSSAAVFDALAHPIRVLILQHVLRGVRTTAELGALAELGTSGQLYHHLGSWWPRAGCSSSRAANTRSRLNV